MATNINGPTIESLLNKLRTLVALPFIWFTWFIVYYSLASINRKRSIVHARFMLATILFLFGPIIDRIVFPLGNIADYIRPESVAFFLETKW
ncbi:MAG: hypothetical protein EOO10_03750 [Chitinophagaceae bacterium]|nr:MAG: hypothetical protein EOO10_03750 [Chitinophagaceae bacterium]